MRKIGIFMSFILLLIVLSACTNDEPTFQPNENDVVDTHGNITNREQFTMFIDNVNNGSADDIRIVSYTNEGDPVLWRLSFDGQTIFAEYDMRFDKFGSGKVHYNKCKSIKTEEQGEYTEYKLTDCEDEQLINLLLTVYLGNESKEK